MPRSPAARLTPLAGALGAALSLACLTPVTAWANTINVTNCNDHGAGSLRSALLAANSSDTVSLTGLSACTITLSTAALPVGVNSLKIQGPVNNSVTIDAKQNYRVFDHTGTGTLTLDHLVLANGKYNGTSAGNGGCIRSAGSVSLHSTTAANCIAYAQTGKARGGAIFATNGVTLANSTISGSVAESVAGAYGGAVYGKAFTATYATLSDDHVLVPSGKSANLNAKFHGGAVFSQSGAVNITSSTFQDDTAVGYTTNGGCLLANGTTYIGASTFSGCQAYANSQARGGAIVVSGALTLAHSALTGNLAGGNFGAYGGGALVSSIVASYSTISDNFVGGGPNGFSGYMEGGGLFVYQGATTIANSTISGNAVGGIGGGIFGFHSNITLSNSTVSGNVANGNGSAKSGTGAGIAMSPNANTAATLKLLGSTIAFNEVYTSFGAYDGAGVRAYGTLVSQSSIIANNTKHGVPSDLSCNCGTVGAPKISGANNAVMVVDPAGIQPPPGMVIVTADPRLAPLGNHGGETRTHAPGPGSPVLGLGNNAGNFTTDQRGAGYARLNGGLVDIGAYERQPNDDEIFYSGLQ